MYLSFDGECGDNCTRLDRTKTMALPMGGGVGITMPIRIGVAFEKIVRKSMGVLCTYGLLWVWAVLWTSCTL